MNKTQKDLENLKKAQKEALKRLHEAVKNSAPKKK